MLKSRAGCELGREEEEAKALYSVYRERNEKTAVVAGVGGGGKRRELKEERIRKLKIKGLNRRCTDVHTQLKIYFLFICREKIWKTK